MIRTPPYQQLAGYYLAITTTASKVLGPTLFKVEIDSTSSSDKFLQIHTLSTSTATGIPANGAVPIYAPQRVLANWSGILQFPVQGMKFNSPGVVLVISTTENTLTVEATDTTKFNITALVEEHEVFNDPNLTTVGDLTTLVASRTIWSEASGATRKSMRKLRLQNTAVTDKYAVVYAVDSPGASSLKVLTTLVPASSAVVLCFGLRNGLIPMQEDADGTLHYGCVVQEQAALTNATVSPTSDFYIQATYI
jgi:hypothetical protein